MYVIFFLFIIIVMASLILFFSPVRVFFYLNTNDMDMNIKAVWLSVIKTDARLINSHMFINVQLFRWKVISRFIKSKPHLNMIHRLNLQDTIINIRYGLDQPYLAGVFYAVISIIGSLVFNTKIEVTPHFMSNDFLIVEAKTTLNTGKTIINILKEKLSKRRKSYGPV